MKLLFPSDNFEGNVIIPTKELNFGYFDRLGTGDFSLETETEGHDFFHFGVSYGFHLQKDFRDSSYSGSKDLTGPNRLLH